MYAAGLISANIMTLYLEWGVYPTVVPTSSRLDLGIANSDYIVGDWTNHSIIFASSEHYSDIASLQMSGIKFNGVQYLDTGSAILVPVNEQPYVLTFGQKYDSIYQAFVKAFNDIASDFGW